MHINCRISISCNNAEEANLINNALEIDNEGYVTSVVKENVIIATVESENSLSLLNTINDFLSCLALAVDIKSASCGKRA
jgi:hypothetical protein